MLEAQALKSPLFRLHSYVTPDSVEKYLKYASLFSVMREGAFERPHKGIFFWVCAKREGGTKEKNRVKRKYVKNKDSFSSRLYKTNSPTWV